MALFAFCRSNRLSSNGSLIAGIWIGLLGALTGGLAVAPMRGANPPVACGDSTRLWIQRTQPGPLSISTQPMGCTGLIPITPAGLQQVWGLKVENACDLQQFHVQLERFGVQVGGLEVHANGWFRQSLPQTAHYISNVVPGRYRLLIDAYDACRNRCRDTLEFRVEDRIAPVMKCDDRINLSLFQSEIELLGYSKISAADVDEGSTDNCALQWRRVRRTLHPLVLQHYLDFGFDWNADDRIDPEVDGFDWNGDGDIADFGEAFTLVNGQLMSPLLEEVHLFCEDYGQPLFIELWGEDKNGNRSYCWMDQTMAPTCTLAPNLVLFQDDPRLAGIDSLQLAQQLFGDRPFSLTANCQRWDTLYSVTKNLQCGAGTLERTWSLVHPALERPLLTCRQTITLLPKINYGVRFPRDTAVSCLPPPPDPLLLADCACEQVQVQVSDQRFPGIGRACYRIFRTYTVVNTCLFDPRCGNPTDPANVFPIERYWGNYGEQAIYFQVSDPAANGIPQFSVSWNRDPAEGFLNDGRIGPNNDEHLQPRGCSATGQYTHAFSYTQIITVEDTLAPTVVVPTVQRFCSTSLERCEGPVALQFSASDNCGGEVRIDTNQLWIAILQDTIATNWFPPRFFDRSWQIQANPNQPGTYTVTIANLPEGTHALMIQAVDPCGNRSHLTPAPFVVADCQVGVPRTLSALTVDLHPDEPQSGNMRVAATDFLVGPLFDCNGQGPDTEGGLKRITQYSVNRQGEPSNRNQTGLTVGCGDVGKTLLLEIHAWDEAGNSNYSPTALLLTDRNNACNGGGNNIATLSGVIRTEEGEAVKNVIVGLSESVQLSQSSAADGSFLFRELPQGAGLRVQPYLDANHLNGISTFDLVLIQNHLFGVELLDSPYKLIAADINNSKSISTLDLIQLRKLVLNLTTRFEDNTSWRFVDAQYRFPDPSNPWLEPFPETVRFAEMPEVATANFVGVKIGDVSGNALNDLPRGPLVRGQSRATLEVLDQTFSAGATIEVVLELHSPQDSLKGFQFFLNWETAVLELVAATPLGLSEENMAVLASAGQLAGLEYAPASSSFSALPLVKLQFRTRRAGHLRQHFGLSHRLGQSETYLGSGTSGDLDLIFKTAKNPDGMPLAMELLQNTPNPFVEQTRIKFFLPTSSVARLLVHDANGRLVFQTQQACAAGWHDWPLEWNDPTLHGVFFYTLETPTQRLTKKMVVLRP